MYLLVMVPTLYQMMLVRLESTSSSGKPIIQHAHSKLGVHVPLASQFGGTSQFWGVSSMTTHVQTS